MQLIRFDDPAPSEADLEVYGVVLRETNRWGVDPSMSREAEDFFIDLLAGYEGTLEELPDWLAAQLPRHFIALGDRPRWIQGAAWPFAGTTPLVLAGQLDITARRGTPASAFVHDDTSLYVFIGAESEPVVVIQQY